MHFSRYAASSPKVVAKKSLGLLLLLPFASHSLAEVIEIDLEVELDPSQIYDCGGGAYPPGTMCWTNNQNPPVSNFTPRQIDASSDEVIVNVTFANNQAIRWATDGISVPFNGDESVQVSVENLSGQSCCTGTWENKLSFDITGNGDLNYNDLQWTSSGSSGGLVSQSYQSGLTNFTDSFFEVRGFTTSIGPYENTTVQPYFIERVVIFFTSGLFSYVTLPPALTPVIDVIPGSEENRLNLKSQGLITVAVFGSENLDVTQINVSTASFGPGQAGESHGRAHIEDLNQDVYPDLVLHFNIRDTGIVCEDSQATLQAELFSGDSFEATDSVAPIGCNNALQGSRSVRN